jgi:hypothetical protein
MRPFALALALATVAALPSAAQAKSRTVEHLNIKGDTATASWDYTEGDIVTFVNVVVTNDNQSGSAGKGENAYVSLSISQAEVSTGNVLIAGVAYTEGNTFSFVYDKAKGTATLDVPTAIFQDDNSFTFFDVSLHLTFTATSEAVQMRSNDRYSEPGLRIVSHFVGSFRDAVAVGSVYGKGIEFTPVASSLGQLQQNNFGSSTITVTSP